MTRAASIWSTSEVSTAAGAGAALACGGASDRLDRDRLVMLGDRRGLGLGLADDRSAALPLGHRGPHGAGSGAALEAHQQSVGVAADPGLRVGAQIEDHASHRIGRRAVLRRADALDLA